MYMHVCDLAFHVKFEDIIKDCLHLFISSDVHFE